MSLFKKILLVDDDEDSNFLTKRIIVRSNIADEVATALNGKEAFEVVRKCKEKIWRVDHGRSIRR